MTTLSALALLKKVLAAAGPVLAFLFDNSEKIFYLVAAVLSYFKMVVPVSAWVEKNHLIEILDKAYWITEQGARFGVLPNGDKAAAAIKKFEELYKNEFGKAPTDKLIAKAISHWTAVSEKEKITPALPTGD